MAAFLVVGLSYLGTTCYYSAIGFAIYEGVRSAVISGTTVLSSYSNAALTNPQLQLVPTGVQVALVATIATVATVGGGIYGAVAGYYIGYLLPIRIVLVGTMYGTYYGSQLTYSACTVLVSLALLPARALVYCVTYTATATMEGGKYVIELVSPTGEKQKLEIDPENWEKSFNVTTRESLLKGEHTEIQTYVPFSTKHLSPKQVYETYMDSKKENFSFLMKTPDDFFYIVQPELDVPCFVKLCENWDKDNKCYYCESAFGYLYSRRHHCRNCGHSVCDQHGARQGFAVSQDKTERLCEYCFLLLKEEEEARVEELKNLMSQTEEGAPVVDLLKSFCFETNVNLSGSLNKGFEESQQSNVVNHEDRVQE